MIQDVLTTFSSKQAVTVTAASTDYVDLGATGTPTGSSVALVRDIGKSCMAFLAQVTTAFADGTSIALSIQTDDNTSFSSPKTVFTTPAIATATLTAGYQFPIKEVPMNTLERYVRVYYTVVGTMSAGNVSAAVTTALQTNV